jgi:uncharacterized membrane protein YphA (DoxX/SURF4 family)
MASFVYRWLTTLLQTELEDYTALALRVGLGLMRVPHGVQKRLGWFGSFGTLTRLAALSGEAVRFVIGTGPAAYTWLGLRLR